MLDDSCEESVACKFQGRLRLPLPRFLVLVALPSEEDGTEYRAHCSCPTAIKAQVTLAISSDLPALDLGPISSTLPFSTVLDLRYVFQEPVLVSAHAPVAEPQQEQEGGVGG